MGKMQWLNFKQYVLEVEKELGHCLTHKSMTNEQALAFIRIKHGAMAVALCKELLESWKDKS